MIKKSYRFHSRGGVRYTYQNGKTIRGAKISLVFADNSRNKQRYAVVVSKKNIKVRCRTQPYSPSYLRGNPRPASKYPEASGLYFYCEFQRDFRYRFQRTTYSYPRFT